MPGFRELSPFVGEYAASEEMSRAVQLLMEAPEVRLGGFVGASLAFFLSAWKNSGRPGSGGPALILTASEEEADELVEELGALAVARVMAFPAWDSLFLPDTFPDGEIYRQRLLVLKQLLSDPMAPCFVVASVQAVLQPVPPEPALRQSQLILRTGGRDSPQALAESLARRGLRSVTLVESRGEFSLRGDILDVFPYDHDNPVRLEFLGDTIESLREFRAEDQRSIAGGERREVAICLPRREDFFRDCVGEGEPSQRSFLTEYLGPSGKLFAKEPQTVADRARKLLISSLLGGKAEAAFAGFLGCLSRVPRVGATTLPPQPGAPGLSVGFRSVERFRGGDLEQVFQGISERVASGCRFEVYCESAAEGKRFREILEDHGLAETAAISIRVGAVRRGFEIVPLSSVILTTREIFQRHIVRRIRRKSVPSRAIQSFFELQTGDYVVHLTHGIGRYLGIESLERSGVVEEFLAVEFRDKVKVYVPVSKIDLVQKYIGSGDRPVILDKVGGTSWARKKEEVEKALLDLASDLIEIQALREARPGFAYPLSSEWQREFEAAFAFEETPDQVEATGAIHRDMESSRPMDRLLCGDVGYGKTELAMRAAFKAVDAGKQVAVLVPTTVLAQQHFRTFSERVSGFPISVEVLSRFRTQAEQRETVKRLLEGKLDIVIGTHRLLSDDVAFRDLGLVIIDEEQRFGVSHKERLKRMRSTVDVLTLTATPIPRTLHMALLGIRDISSLTTAPEGRCPVKTEIIQFEPPRIREILFREFNRDGQVYFVHNRIDDIHRVVQELRALAPEARIDYAHGQMNEHELEDKMLRFFEGEIDCLVSTTIIENGLDIPNVNTILIDEADLYGLADLHQLRGRVGRYKHQAYCYLILPWERSINPEAQRRVQALVEFSDLGSGFQIAMRDLEIRGAGNILGPEQSGHIAAVGYDMYCRLLEKAARRLKNEPVSEAEPVEVEIDFALNARVPDIYRRGESAKIALYRRIAAASTLQAVDDLGGELEDRFGPYPPEVARLLDVQRLRLLCAARGVEYIGREDNNLVLEGTEAMGGLVESFPHRAVILDARTVVLPLVDPRRSNFPRLSDERVFQIALGWLKTGVFSVLGRGVTESGPAPRLLKPRGIRAGQG